MAWTLAAAKWQALAVILLFTGVATVGVRAGYQSPTPAVVPPIPDPPPRQDPPQAQTTTKPDPADYPAWIKLGLPEVREIRQSETFQGRVVAARTVKIRPRTNDIITKVEAGEGDMVQQGQLLFKVGTPESRPVLENGRLMRQEAHDRLEKIREVTKNQRNLAQDRAEKELDQIDNEIERLIKQNQTSRIVAPFAGQIALLTAAVGKTVEAGKTPLAWIVRGDPIQVDFQVDEQNYVKIQRWLRSQPGMTHLPIQVALADEEVFDHQGKVLFRATQFESYGDGRRCTLHAELPNPDGALVPGLTARVRIDYGDSRQATLIPTESSWNLSIASNTATVWVVDANRIAHQRNLRNRPGLTSQVEASDKDSGCHGFGTPTPCLKPWPASRGRSTEPVAPREIGKLFPACSLVLKQA